ncbi:hypothetical protein [Deinococcus peraridilitoris]|uniref:HNH endonuclease n=1 Tax=Deinococcus peraridilitoris (strain DSM 19664 / LMG 22246 / CIP 109416 / KR-200) TaxID=937777 RepID=L0A358_DEIPD|nr:hypothetical protein [Deinococcus peraridilitoris]AFZ68333.1 hypothetical protein Deipe_2870 [Deinococcus peraridilitoris DSM 19664]
MSTHDAPPQAVTLRDGTVVLLDPDTAAQVAGMAFRRDPTSGAVVRKVRVGTGVKTQTLAQFVMGGAAPPGMLWHHKSGDASDFRRENLQAVRRGTHLPDGHHRKAGQASGQAKRLTRPDPETDA